MTSVCYLIVCVNLLYYFEQAQSFSPTKIRNVQNYREDVVLNSLSLKYKDLDLSKEVSPYWNMSYDEQLNLKQNTSIFILHKLEERSNQEINLTMCKLFRIVHSPVINAYRNKDIFFLRRGCDGNRKTVAYKLVSLKFGNNVYIQPSKIDYIKESHRRVAKVYEDFIRKSPLPASISSNDNGHWNTLLVRSTEAGDILASVSVRPRGYAYETIHNEKRKMKEYFFKRLPNITLYHQVCGKNRCPHKVAPFVLLYGKLYLLESLNGFWFKILPDTIFPNNKIGTELLYDNFIRMAKLKPNTTVFDLCSTTGTNSVVISKYVREVVGLTYFKDVITEAKELAEYNNINNINFQFGQVKYNMMSVLERLNASSDVVVLLSPRSGGIGLDLLKSIRSSLKISRIVLLYFKHNSPHDIQNVIDLCSNKFSGAPPFRLAKAIPFDLRPWTPFVELIFIFQRDPVTNM